MHKAHSLTVFKIDGGVEDHGRALVLNIGFLLHVIRDFATRPEVNLARNKVMDNSKARSGGEIMKQFIAAGLLGLGLTGAAYAAGPAVGTWQTQVDDGAYAHVKMAPCGGAVCGTIARTFNDSGEYKSPNIGKTLVIDMKPEGGGKYAGKVWRPSNGKIYIGKMDVAGDSLKLSGCIAGGLICSKQTWARIK
tara:strand:- start:96 stop:671 length:576 start_codon:yes stop_codon:yes gene_type:complete